MSTTTTEPRVFDQGSRPPPRLGPTSWLILAVVGLVLGAGLAVVLRPDHDQIAQPVLIPPTAEAPLLATAGPAPDWGIVVRSILAYDDWLRVHPDPTKVADIYDPSGPDYTEAVIAISALASGDRRYVIGPDPKPVEVVTLQARDDTSASVFVRYGPLPAARVVDRAGNIVSDLPARPGNFTWWRLVLGQDGRWRLAGTRQA